MDLEGINPHFYNTGNHKNGDQRVGGGTGNSTAENDAQGHGHDQGKKQTALADHGDNLGQLGAEAGADHYLCDDCHRSHHNGNLGGLYRPTGHARDEIPHAGTGGLAGEADAQHQQGGPEGGEPRAHLHDQHHGQHGQWNDENTGPLNQHAHVHSGGNALYPVLARDEFHIDADGHEIEYRGYECGDHDRGKGHAEKSRHKKGRGPHDRRHDLTAGRCRRFNRRGDFRLIAKTLHGGDGKRPGDHDVGQCRTGSHTYQRAADDRGLAGAAFAYFTAQFAHFQKKDIGAHDFQTGAEQHQQKTEFHDHAENIPENS